MAGLLDDVRALFPGDRPKVPVIRSDSAVECGAACLAMILGHYGRETSMDEAYERCRVGRDGATAHDIARAGRSYGLRVDPYSLELDALQDLDCPAVLHWSFEHFVVLESWDGREAIIVDPARGRVTVEPDEMSANFTGVALAMAPGTGFDAGGTAVDEPAWQIVARRAFSARGARRLVVQILLASLLLQVFGLCIPILTKVIVDSVLPLQLQSAMAILGIGILVILATQLVAALLRGYLLVTLQARLDARLMTSFLDHVFALPYRYFQERSTGDLLQRLSSNVQIRNVLSNQTLTAVLDGSLVVVYALVLLVASPMFGLVAITLGAIQVGILVATSRRMVALVTRELEAIGTSQGFLAESIAGIEALKASGAESRSLTHWTGLFAEQIEASMQRGRLAAVIGAVTTTIQRFSPLLLLWVGAYSVLDGSMTLGYMLALVSLSQLFLAPLGTLVAAGMQIQQVGGHLERIASVLRVDPEQSLHATRPAPRLEGEIELDRVSFRYDEASPWAIRDVSLHIRPGMKVALVGRSGSGKSTLAKLLLGLYVPTEGDIRFDGISLHELDLRTVRAQCGVVMQDPTVFNGTIRHNVSFHDPSLPLSEVARAAKVAELHEDISRMPMGYSTRVAEGGSALSGGQRQRMAIARAMSHAPRILVLDEATSDLDSETESIVSEHLARERMTSVVIAHRLSTVENADVILVFDGGEVIERGTHSDLLEANSVYATLVRDQLVDTDALQ